MIGKCAFITQTGRLQVETDFDELSQNHPEFGDQK